MKKIILNVFTLVLFISSCSKEESNVAPPEETKVYKVFSVASCISNTVTNVSDDDIYIEFDSPSFTPIVNKWYKDETNVFYFKFNDLTLIQGDLSQRVLISQHYDTYCQ
jgi:PBP1b-binding outer membrane lipoprotein LpoB